MSKILKYKGRKILKIKNGKKYIYSFNGIYQNSLKELKLYIDMLQK